MDFIRDKILNIGEKELKLDNLGEDVVVEKEQPIQEKEQEVEIEEVVNPAPAAQQEAEEAQSKENNQEDKKRKILYKIRDAKDLEELEKIETEDLSDLTELQQNEIQNAIEAKKTKLQPEQEQPNNPSKEEERKIPSKSFLKEDDSAEASVAKKWEAAVAAWNDKANKILRGDEQIFSGLNDILKGILDFSLKSSGVEKEDDAVATPDTSANTTGTSEEGK